MQTLERYAFPILGGGAVDRIFPADGLAVASSIRGTRPEAARRDRQRIHAVHRWSSAHGLVIEHVAGVAIDGALPPLPGVKSHLRALTYPEVVSSRLTLDRTCRRGDGALCAPGRFLGIERRVNRNHNEGKCCGFRLTRNMRLACVTGSGSRNRPI